MENDFARRPLAHLRDWSYIALAVTLPALVFQAAGTHASRWLGWTGALPFGTGPWVAMLLGLLGLVALIASPALLVLTFPRRWQPSLMAVAAAFLLFNGYLYFSAVR